MFPYIMILSTLIFFDGATIERVISKIKPQLGVLPAVVNHEVYTFRAGFRKPMAAMFAVFFLVQAIVPWRHAFTKGELFWTEEGYRFSWRVMLMEKMGYAQFVVKDKNTGKKIGINNNDYLTKNQEKMMATQPDFILQYAHFLRDQYKAKGIAEPEVYATIYVTLNGRRSRLYVDETRDLAKEYDSFKHKSWMKDFQDNIYGL